MNYRTLRYAFAGAVVLVAALTWWWTTARHPAPQSEFVLLDGSRQSMQALEGKVTFVNFWATSCAPCVAEIPDLIRTYEQYQAAGLEMVAVAMSYDKPEYVVNFVQSRQLPFKVAIDNTGQVAKEWGDVQLTPTGFLVDKRGAIVKTYVGAPRFEELHLLIEQLLAEPAV